MCVMDFGVHWDLHLLLIEIAYSNSHHASIEWLHTKHYIEENADRLFVGILVRDS